MKKIKAEDFDRAFENGEDVTKHLDKSTGRRINTEQKRISVSFPMWLVASLEQEALRLGISKQSLVKMWITERLKEAHLNSGIQ